MNEDEKFFCKLCCREISEETNIKYKGYCQHCYIDRFHQTLKNEKASNIKKEKSQFAGILIALLIGIILAVVLFSTNLTEKNESKKPDEIELMSYAQTVLDDNLNNPIYSSYKKDYTFINTNLRYKIEGNVTTNNITNKFYMIIEFVDDSYKVYDLISLQVGNNMIYQK